MSRLDEIRLSLVCGNYDRHRKTYDDIVYLLGEVERLTVGDKAVHAIEVDDNSLLFGHSYGREDAVGLPIKETP